MAEAEEPLGYADEGNGAGEESDEAGSDGGETTPFVDDGMAGARFGSPLSPTSGMVGQGIAGQVQIRATASGFHQMPPGLPLPPPRSAALRRPASAQRCGGIHTAASPWQRPDIASHSHQDDGASLSEVLVRHPPPTHAGPSAAGFAPSRGQGTTAPVPHRSNTVQQPPTPQYTHFNLPLPQRTSLRSSPKRAHPQGQNFPTCRGGSSNGGLWGGQWR